MHLDAWGEFAIDFLQNYTVKWLDDYYRNIIGHSE